MSRLIIVGNATFEPPHTHGLDIGHVTIQTSSQQPSGGSIDDPVDHVLAFYLPKEISVDTAKTLFRAAAPGFDDGLKRSLAEEWISQHCTLPVIAQKDPNSWAQWIFFVCDGTLRREQFYNWAIATAAHQVQKFRIQVPEEEKIGLALEIDRSVHELIRGKKFISHSGSTIHVSVWDETDAVEFKLKWSDYFV